MAPFLPIRAISRSQRVRIGGATVKTTETTYVDMNPEAKSKPAAYSPLKELHNHLTLGAVVVVGPLTNSTSDWVVVSGLTVKGIKKGEAKKGYEVEFNVGEVEQRSTGKYLAVAAETTAEVKNTGATKERIDLFYLLVEGAEAGKVKFVEGAEAAKEKAVVPATPAKAIPIATLARYNEAEVKAEEFKDVRPRP